MSTRIDVRNPRTGAIDFSFEAADEAAVAAEARRLREGQKGWEALGLDGRIHVMLRWCDALERHRAAIAAADAEDTGQGQVSRMCVDMTLAVIRATCAQAPGLIPGALRSGVSPAFPAIHYDTMLKAIPLVGVISPWNGPTMLSMMRSIAPLVAGCAVLLKPSEVTPRFTGPIFESVAEVPDLAAVFGCVLGAGATGAAVVENVDLVNFCGSVTNGRRVAEACGRRLIPCELELGGKDPLIVTASADLDLAAIAAARGALTSTGQVCFSIERVYVERPVYAAFLEKLVDRCGRMKINYPDPLDGPISPFISKAQADLVDGQIADAVARGATIVTGGPSFELGGGRYMKPTILTDVTHDMSVMRDETFGPIIPVMPYDTADEAVALANDTIFGLSAAVMAGSVAEARAIGERINAGNISLQDAHLTFAASPAEADSHGVSGMGGRRSGILRYLKRTAFLHNTGTPACLSERPLSAAA